MKTNQFVCVVASFSLFMQPVGAAWAQNVTIHQGGQSTSVVTATNGTDIVNVTAPNAAGLSHNVYDQFNVGSTGLVWNNNNLATNSASNLTGLDLAALRESDILKFTENGHVVLMASQDDVDAARGAQAENGIVDATDASTLSAEDQWKINVGTMLATGSSYLSAETEVVYDKATTGADLIVRSNGGSLVSGSATTGGNLRISSDGNINFRGIHCMTTSIWTLAVFWKLMAITLRCAIPTKPLVGWLSMLPTQFHCNARL